MTSQVPALCVHVVIASHAAHIDLAVCQWLTENVAEPTSELYDTMCAFGNFRLAYHEDLGDELVTYRGRW